MFYFFLFLLLVLIFIIFSDIVVDTTYTDGDFSVKVQLLKITVFDNKKIKIKPEKTESKKEIKSVENKKKFSFEILKEYITVIQGVLPEVKKTIKYFKRKIKCKKFLFDMVFGLSDAAECGIANGLIWAVEGQIFVVLNEIIAFKKPKIAITPVFNNRDSFAVKYEGIYRLKTYHIIILGIYFIKIYNKYKKLKGGVKNG